MSPRPRAEVAVPNELEIRVMEGIFGDRDLCPKSAGVLVRRRRNTMTHDAESLLEVDRIDDVLEVADQPQPVVVIQYGRKRPSWFWIMALVILIPLGGLWFYHRLEVENLRSRTSLRNESSRAGKSGPASKPLVRNSPESGACRCRRRRRQPSRAQ